MARKLRVWVDQHVCVGNAMCETIATNTFRLNDNRQSEAVNPEGDSVEKILEAVNPRRDTGHNPVFNVAI